MILKQIESDIYGKTWDAHNKGEERPLLTIVFSPEGYAEAMNSRDLFRYTGANVSNNTIMGCRFVVVKDQIEFYRIVER